VHSLVPANADVHTFSPRPSDIRTLAEARLVVMNGLGLDDWLRRMIDAVATGAPVVVLGENLPGVDYQTGEEDGGPPNPHVWMNVAYGELYVDRIAQALEQADPSHADAYRAQAATYRRTLAALDAQIASDLAAIPAANRRVVAFHDAFLYYAARYGLEIVGVAVAAPGQDPGAGYTAQLISAIRAAHVKAIFAEAQFPPKLVQQLAAETGTAVVATLYDDAVGDPPADSYVGVLRWDTDEFLRALR
jgi:zinc/manganese transport system substrate-binding protein